MTFRLLRAFLLILTVVLARPRVASAEPSPWLFVHVPAPEGLEGPAADEPIDLVTLLTRRRARLEPVARDLRSAGVVVEHVSWIASGILVRSGPEGIPPLTGIPGIGEIEVAHAPRPSPLVDLPDEGGSEAVPWNIQKVRADDVWRRYRLDGRGIRVGVIDTGVDASHPDLAGKVIAFQDFLDRDQRAPHDPQGHGTLVCGILAGGSRAGRSIGVAPGVQLLVARALNGPAESPRSILEAMEWMMDPDGNPRTADQPRILSNSWILKSSTSRYYWTAVQTMRRLGVFPSFGAGNDGPGAGTVRIPAAYPHAFALGATDRRDGVVSSSSRGPARWDEVRYVKPDLAAPGGGVTSARTGGGYRTATGTSLACPHLSGTVALMLQANPGLRIHEVEAILRQTAVDLGPEGPDHSTGSGRLDAWQAVTRARGAAGFDVPAW